MTRFRRLLVPLLARWNRLSLRAQGIIKAGLPLLAVLFTAGMAFVGNRQRAHTEAALLRHFALDEHLAELLTLMLNAETGLRGHLITQRAEFLGPFELAERDLPGQLAKLAALVDAEPGEEPRRERQRRLEGIQRTVAEEMRLLRALRDEAGGEGLDARLARSKETMDRLRASLHRMRAVEQALLSDRLSDIRRVRQRDYLTIAAALLLGIGTRVFAFYFFQRRVVERVDQIAENLRAVKQGEAIPHPPSGTRDAIGELEKAVARLEPRRDDEPGPGEAAQPR